MIDSVSPRIPELPEPLSARQLDVYREILAGRRGRVRGPLALWLYSPELASRAQKLGELLRYESIFPPVLSELAILLVARHARCSYEWGVHAPIAVRNGVPAELVELIRRGDHLVGASQDQLLVAEYVFELLKHCDVTEDVFRRFEGRFGARGIVEIAALVGYYMLGAYTLNAVRLPSPDGTEPFK